MDRANSKYINVESGLERLANNEALYKRLLSKFEESVSISEFTDALAAQDYVKAGEVVHTAKGIAGNLSLVALYDNSVILMDQFREGGVPQKEMTDAFTSLYVETVRAINEYIG